MKKTSVSLIISTYNWPGALRLSISSALSQTVFPDEIIIADDGSKPETKALIESLASSSSIPIHHVWHEDKGFRVSEIRNKAIHAAKGDYIIQIDGDIIIHPNFIEDHVKMSAKDYFLCGSRTLIPEKYSKEILSTGSYKGLKKAKLPLSSILNSIRIPFLTNILADRYKKNQPKVIRGCNISFWKTDILEVNGYNNSIQGWGSEDSELGIRLINKGVKRRFIKFAAVGYHIHHKINDRSNKERNELILEKTILDKIIWTENGISQLK